MSINEINYLNELLQKLDKAKNTLNYSYSICDKIGVKDSYNEDEEDRFEALTSKFARLSDLILKKAVKTIDLLDLDEAPATMRDAISRAEKKGLIAEEFKFVEIRKKRNEIAHEYISSDDDIYEIYKYVLLNTKFLFEAVDRIINYSQKYLN